MWPVQVSDNLVSANFIVSKHWILIHVHLNGLFLIRDVHSIIRGNTHIHKQVEKKPERPLWMAYQQSDTFSLFLFSLPILIIAISGNWSHQT